MLLIRPEPWSDICKYGTPPNDDIPPEGNDNIRSKDPSIVEVVVCPKEDRVEISSALSEALPAEEIPINAAFAPPASDPNVIRVAARVATFLCFSFIEKTLLFLCLDKACAAGFVPDALCQLVFCRMTCPPKRSSLWGQGPLRREQAEGMVAILQELLPLYGKEGSSAEGYETLGMGKCSDEQSRLSTREASTDASIFNSEES